MALDRHEFTKRFLGGTIDVRGDQTDTETTTTTDTTLEDGIIIKCAPLFKSSAQRLKGVLVRHVGDTTVYLDLEGQVIKAGKVNLNFANFTEINQVINMYQPEYFKLTNGQRVEFNKFDLIETAVLPVLEQRDYYMR